MWPVSGDDYVQAIRQPEKGKMKETRVDDVGETNEWELEDVGHFR